MSIQCNVILKLKDAWGNNHALVVEQLTWDYKVGFWILFFLKYQSLC